MVEQLIGSKDDFGNSAFQFIVNSDDSNYKKFFHPNTQLVTKYCQGHSGSDYLCPILTPTGIFDVSDYQSTCLPFLWVDGLFAVLEKFRQKFLVHEIFLEYCSHNFTNCVTKKEYIIVTIDLIGPVRRITTGHQFRNEQFNFKGVQSLLLVLAKIYHAIYPEEQFWAVQ